MQHVVGNQADVPLDAISGSELLNRLGKPIYWAAMVAAETSPALDIYRVRVSTSAGRGRVFFRVVDSSAELPVTGKYSGLIMAALVALRDRHDLANIKSQIEAAAAPVVQALPADEPAAKELSAAEQLLAAQLDTNKKLDVLIELNRQLLSVWSDSASTPAVQSVEVRGLTLPVAH